MENGSEKLVYVGRDDCPECVKVRPQLEQFVNEEKTVLYYYCTTADREKNPEELRERLSSFGVDTIPSFLIVGEKEIRRFDYNSFVHYTFIRFNLGVVPMLVRVNKETTTQ